MTQWNKQFVIGHTNIKQERTIFGSTNTHTQIQIHINIKQTIHGDEDTTVYVVWQNYLTSTERIPVNCSFSWLCFPYVTLTYCMTYIIPAFLALKKVFFSPKKKKIEIIVKIHKTQLHPD